MPAAADQLEDRVRLPLDGLVQRDAFERDLVAREEPGHPVHTRIEARPDDAHLGLGLLGGDRLQGVEVAPREAGDASRHRRRHRGERVVHRHVELDDARELRSPAAGRERGAQRHRHLAEELSRLADADHALLAVDHLGDLGTPLDDHEQRPLVALVREVLAGQQADVLHRLRQVLERLRRQGLEDRDATESVDGDHAGNSEIIGEWRCPVAPTTYRVIGRTYRSAVARSTPRRRLRRAARTS